MTLTINGFHQHVVSYYTLEDAVAGRLRRPSTIPEFTALDISPEYLNVANFRYPPTIEMGQDGVPRYHGEQDDRPVSPARIPTAYADIYADPYGHAAAFDSHHGPRMRAVTVPTISSGFSQTVPSPGYPVPPGSAGGYYDQQPMHTMAPAPRPTGPMRPNPTQSSRRYEPYGGNPRALGPGESGHVRRQSQPPPITDPGYYQPSEYNYQPPSTAPGAFPYYSAAAAPPPSQPPMASPIVSPGYPSSQYGGWHQPAMRMMPSLRSDMLHAAGDPPSSAGSIDSAPGSSGAHMVPPSDGWAPVSSSAPPGWESHPPQMAQSYAVAQGDGWQAGLA